MDKGPFKGIIAIARGGMIPAALVSRELEIRIIDTICAASYAKSAEEGAQNARSEVKILKGVDHDGEGYLLIDDLVDTGACPGDSQPVAQSVFRDLVCQADGARGR